MEPASLARRSETKAAVPRLLATETPVSRAALPYSDALAWLYSLQRFGIKLGLENICRLIAELGLGSARPLPAVLRDGDAGVASRATPGASPGVSLDPRVIHVAGTNGKGSVCAMIDAICRAQGYRTGLFTSPHLVTFRERIQVDGKMISEEEAAARLATIRKLVADWDPHPTFFEVTTALALKYFADANLDIVILETGLGGRLDATNAVQSDVSVITPIDLDHEKWLGDSIEKIAVEKAGIMKSGVPVVSAPQKTEAARILEGRAAECRSPIEFVTASRSRDGIALPGAHQQQNAALAIAAVRAAGIDLDHAAIVQGLAAVTWPARFQRWDERTIIDGAHNPAAARVVAKTWRELFGNQRATVILAVLSDKNLREICKALAPITDSFLLPKIRSDRAADPTELTNALATIAPLLPHSITPSLEEALAIARARPNPILLTGSLHFAGEVLAHLRGEPAAFEECAQ
jgi:dihydrofolate synthase / folylpolyglutamate synthase